MDKSCKNPDCDHKPGGMLWSKYGAYGHGCRWPRGAVGDTRADAWYGPRGDCVGPQGGCTGPQGSTGSEEIRALMDRLWHIFA